jgi:hypothetical protein
MSYFGTKDYFVEAARGNLSHVTTVKKFGSASSIGTSLTPVSTAKVYQTPTALTSLELVSDDNTNDIAAGSGARKVLVQGLSTGWTEIEEEVTLTGTTAAALSNQFYRVYRMYVSESGTYANSSAPSHNSTITLRVASAGATWAQIVSEGGFGLAQTEIAAYTVPKGKTAVVLSKHENIETNKSGTIVFFQRPNADVTSAPYEPMRVVSIDRDVADGGEFVFHIPQGPFVGPCDIGFMASFATSGNISIEFEILLFDT